MYVSSNTSSSSSYNSTATIPDFVASTSSSNSFSSSMNDKLSSSNTNDTTSNNKTDSTTSSDNKTNDTSKDSVNNKEGEKTSESKKEDKKEVDEEAVAVATTVENVDTSNMDLALLQMLEEAIKSTEGEVAEAVVASEDVEFQVVTMTDLKVAEMVVDQTIKAEVAVAEEVTAEKAMVIVDEDGNPVEVEEQKEEVEVKVETKQTADTKVSEQETKEVAKTIEKVEVVEEKEVVSEKADTKVEAKVTTEGETEELEVEDVQLTTDKGIALKELATEDKILIKVGNTELSESWQKLADDLGKEILAKSVQGEDRLSVTLNPKGLGEIQVEIAKQDNGVSVSLMCSSKTTAGLLSENIAGLVRILEDNFEEHTVVVENSDQTDNQGLSDQDESRGGEEQEKEEKEDNEKEFALDLQSTFERMRLGIS